jgi:hypothetical protein
MGRMRALLAAAALTACCAATAAEAPAARPPAPAEPVVQRSVTEDDAVRIEELRVRGETQTITVTNKQRALRGTQYEVVPPSGARDPSQKGQSNGQRVWRLFEY